MNLRRLASAAMLAVLPCGAADAGAQTLGTCRWQLQPYCNVLTLTATTVGGAFRVERVRQLELAAVAAPPAALRVDQSDDDPRGVANGLAGPPTRVPEAFEWIAAALALVGAALIYLLRAAGPFV